MDNKNELTDFGYQQVPIEEKAHRVDSVFRSVAPQYDFMNDLMSFGMHRLWKCETIAKANVRPGQYILDMAAGTGDLAKVFARLVGSTGKVILADINDAMLEVGRRRLIDAGILKNVDYIQANAEQLPFTEHCFDCITMAFGLRNVTDKQAALSALYRVLKPGGRLPILEFSHPQNLLLNKLYEFYSFHFIPKMGEIVARDKASYQYLIESIRRHPDQETLKTMMLSAGFEEVEYNNLSQGIVALHSG